MDDRKTHLYAEPRILPLDAQADIYALQDERGNIIGTGTRDVCEVLLFLITQPASWSDRINAPVPRRPNVRSAIVI